MSQQDRPARELGSVGEWFRSMPPGESSLPAGNSAQRNPSVTSWFRSLRSSNPSLTSTDMSAAHLDTRVEDWFRKFQESNSEPFASLSELDSWYHELQVQSGDAAATATLEEWFRRRVSLPGEPMLPQPIEDWFNGLVASGEASAPPPTVEEWFQGLRSPQARASLAYIPEEVEHWFNRLHKESIEMMPVLASEDGGGGHGNSEGRKLSAPISPVIEDGVD
mmetsp:Transcript_11391/g.27735  ORF Transcript_11391/g.27735 Transcript_11391/m.27735 type:complete len:221 (+) Transcript_11391:83-745(+)